MKTKNGKTCSLDYNIKLAKKQNNKIWNTE